MVKCFLSHSSVDKKSYVEIVAKNVGLSNCVYDKYTFEGGMRPLDEILKGLHESQLFVVFISESALQSDWVKYELATAKKMQQENIVNRIFPLIIDDKINYSDHRIPRWMRDEYNLKYVSRPVIAAKRIRERLTEISWKTHPNLKYKKKLFVGRNSLINEFEERIDDFDLRKPGCIIASGVSSIGRRSLLEHCIDKAKLFGESYRPTYIYLDSQESIEDLIVKIYDLGFSKERDLSNFMSIKVKDKVKTAIGLTDDIHKAKEVVFIIDNGCIVTYDRAVCRWFVDIVNSTSKSELLTFCVVSRFRPDPRQIRNLNSFFYIGVPELSYKERKGLLGRYSTLEGLDLSKDDLKYFSNLLSGYPEQIFFVVHQILDEGLDAAKKDTDLIVDYNSKKVQIILKKWDDDEQIIEFLRLLSEFDFISHELVYEIVGEDDTYKKAMQAFRGLSIVELIGANREYVRVVDNVRDYVKRQKISLKKDYIIKLNSHVKKFLKTYKNEEKDLSDFLFSMQSALKKGMDIDEKYLIPSHFLKTIKTLYDQEKKYSEVVSLSDRVLNRHQYMDISFTRNVRYYLCLALARQRDPRCTKEAHAFSGSQLNFLLGFYYRLKGRYSEAINKLQEALNERSEFARARRELVLVYQYIGEFQLAHVLAKQNYENDKSNPYHIQAYLNCLLKDHEEKEKNSKLIKFLLVALENIPSDTSHEMYLTAMAEFLAFHLNRQESAIDIVLEAKQLYPYKIYPVLMHFDICLKFNDIDGLERVLSEIENLIDKKSYYFNSLVRRKCILVSKKEGYPSATRLMEKYLSNYTERAKDRFQGILYNCSKGIEMDCII